MGQNREGLWPQSKINVNLTERPGSVLASGTGAKSVICTPRTTASRDFPCANPKPNQTQEARKSLLFQILTAFLRFDHLFRAAFTPVVTLRFLLSLAALAPSADLTAPAP